jgi:hypothetical protein
MARLPFLWMTSVSEDDYVADNMSKLERILR